MSLAPKCSMKWTTGSHTLAAIPPMRTDFMKMPQSRRLRNTFVTLIPRLAKPDSPRATWNVSLSLSSWMPAESRSPLDSDVDTTGDELLQTDLFSLLSTLTSEASTAAAVEGAASHVPMVVDVPPVG